MRVRGVATWIVVAGLALSAPSASGALFLAFSGTQAAPGQVVTVQTGGAGALPNIPSSERLRVFLAAAGEASTITSPDDIRLVLLGRLRIDEEGNGFLRFIVPDIPAGDYTSFTHCASCAPTSAGRELLATGPFPGSFVVVAGQDGSSLFPLALAGAAVAIALAAALGWMRRRAREDR